MAPSPQRQVLVEAMKDARRGGADAVKQKAPAAVPRERFLVRLAEAVRAVVMIEVLFRVELGQAAKNLPAVDADPRKVRPYAIGRVQSNVQAAIVTPAVSAGGRLDTWRSASEFSMGWVLTRFGGSQCSALPIHAVGQPDGRIR